jgi:peptidoglycan/LPS O-acetylase OafA/YrhL
LKAQAIEKIPSAHPEYRPDIDGLRAVAVSAVVLYHAFPDDVGGGFVGVDVFFIISGFLISTILLKSLQNGSFSFREFYRRRILRIFPALIAVLMVCYGIGWLVLLPAEFRQLGKHIAGGALFVANLLFWNEAGYFDNVSETKPLLHLWSLGVEEQYYLVWPCLLFLARKRQWHIPGLIGLVMLVSFAVNVHTVYQHPVQSFYSPIARFWELLLGSLLACFQLPGIGNGSSTRQKSSGLKNPVDKHGLPKVDAAARNNCLSLLGALVVVSSIRLIDEQADFPGWWALLPTTGACLIISAGSKAIVNRTILSSRPMVWLGLISYPLYLWHWPLLSFARIIEGKTPAVDIRTGAIALAFLLAWLTYLLIERPIRFGKRINNKVTALALAMSLSVSIGLWAYLEGNVRRATLTDEMLEQIAKLDFGLHFKKWSRCPGEADTWSCRILNPDKPAEIELIGDSHSVHLAAGLAEADTVIAHNIISRSGNGCIPVMEVNVNGKNHYACDGIIDKAIEEAIHSKTVKMIMLSGYAVEKLRPSKRNRQFKEIDGDKAEILEQALTMTLSRLAASGKKVVFFVDTPELDFEPGECVLIRPFYFRWHRKKDPCAVNRQSFELRNAEYHRIVQNAERKFPSVKFIKLHDYLCDRTLCYALKEDVLIYRDRHHLSADGSRYLIERLADQIRL